MHDGELTIRTSSVTTRSRHACLRSHRQPHQLPRVSRHAGAEGTSWSRFSKREARAFGRQPAAMARRRADRRAARGVPRHRPREAARRSRTGEGTEYHVYPPNLHEPYRSRRFKCGEDLYATLGIPREDKARAPAAVRAQLRVLRRAGRAVLLDRPAHGRGSVGGHRHVHAEHHAARARARPAHLPAGGLGHLVQDVGEFLQLPARAHALLRHGARLHGRERSRSTSCARSVRSSRSSRRCAAST